MRLPLCLPLLLATSFAFGQNLHELKTDLVLPFVSIAHLGYEFIPRSRLGIETNMWYSWAEKGNYYIPPISMHPEAIGTSIPTKHQVLVATIGAKYYFFNKRNGTGLFLGGYLRQDILTSHPDKRYEYLFLNNYGYPNYNQGIYKKGLLRFGLGALAGYKYLIGQHLLLEAGVGVDWPIFYKANPNIVATDWFGIPMIRAGYRF